MSQGLLNGPQIRFILADPDATGRLYQKPERPDLAVLARDEDDHRAPYADEDQRQVEAAEVIGDEQKGAARRDVVLPLDVHAGEDPHQHADDCPQEVVHRPIRRTGIGEVRVALRARLEQDLVASHRIAQGECAHQHIVRLADGPLAAQVLRAPADNLTLAIV